jgi:hypothetical protein
MCIFYKCVFTSSPPNFYDLNLQSKKIPQIPTRTALYYKQQLTQLTFGNKPDSNNNNKHNHTRTRLGCAPPQSPGGLLMLYQSALGQISMQAGRARPYQPQVPGAESGLAVRWRLALTSEVPAGSEHHESMASARERELYGELSITANVGYEANRQRRSGPAVAAAASIAEGATSLREGSVCPALGGAHARSAWARLSSRTSAYGAHAGSAGREHLPAPAP